MSLSPDELKANFQRLSNEIWNNHNLNLVAEYYATDYENPAWGVKGTDGFIQYCESIWFAFPDIHFTLEELIVAEDKVVTRWTNRGTQQGPFLGFPATGREFNSVAVIISRLNSDGKIVEDWILSDNLGVLQQVGAIPIPGQ